MTIKEMFEDGMTVKEIEGIFNSPVCAIHDHLMTYGKFSSKPEFEHCQAIRDGQTYYCDSCVNEVRAWQKLTVHEKGKLLRHWVLGTDEHS